jgi:CheY-like chemotaxis protein
MAQRQPISKQARKRPLVFYIEPDDKVAKIYGSELEAQYEVVRYTAGVPVLRWLADHEDDELPNLIVMDYQLPDISGLEVLSALRNNDRYERVFAMILSNHTAPNLVEMAFRKDAFGWMLKASMTPEQVAARIKSTVTRRRRMSATRQRG